VFAGGKQKVRAQQIIDCVFISADTSKSFDLLESQQKGFFARAFNHLMLKSGRIEHN